MKDAPSGTFRTKMCGVNVTNPISFICVLHPNYGWRRTHEFASCFLLQSEMRTIDDSMTEGQGEEEEDRVGWEEEDREKGC